MRHYAKQMKNKQLEIDATEIRIRAERRWGQLYKEGQELGIIARHARPIKVDLDDLYQNPLTLESLGVTKDQSSRAQKLASVPEATFEGMLGEWRERVNRENERVTVNLLKENARHEKEGRYNEQRDASDNYVHEDGSFIRDFEHIVDRGKSGVQEAYGCIYVDPPWAYQNQGTRASTGNHYDTMSVDELVKIPVGEVAADCSHLHLWTTNGFLFECPRLLESWGFTFKSSFVWVKPQIGIGNYWRNAHEILLLGIRG